MSQKTSIDIEDLLVWAYRDMEADKVRVERFGDTAILGSSWGAVDRAAALGAVVRGSAHELFAGDCDDAAAIDRSVMDLDSAFILVDPECGDCQVYDRAMVEGEGGTVDLLPGEWAHLSWGDEVREARVLTVSVQLILHARGATRPDCYADIARRRGRPSKDGEVALGIRWDEVVFARAVYAVWHAALGILAHDLGETLARWAVSGPAAPESPWLRSRGRLLEAVSGEKSTPAKPMRRRRKSLA